MASKYLMDIASNPMDSINQAYQQYVGTKAKILEAKANKLFEEQKAARENAAQLEAQKTMLAERTKAEEAMKAKERDIEFKAQVGDPKTIVPTQPKIEMIQRPDGTQAESMNVEAGNLAQYAQQPYRVLETIPLGKDKSIDIKGYDIPEGYQVVVDKDSKLARFVKYGQDPVTKAEVIVSQTAPFEALPEKDDQLRPHVSVENLKSLMAQRDLAHSQRAEMERNRVSDKSYKELEHFDILARRDIEDYNKATEKYVESQDPKKSPLTISEDALVKKYNLAKNDIEKRSKTMAPNLVKEYGYDKSAIEKLRQRTIEIFEAQLDPNIEEPGRSELISNFIMKLGGEPTYTPPAKTQNDEPQQKDMYNPMLDAKAY